MFRTNGCRRLGLDRFNPQAQWARGRWALPAFFIHPPKAPFSGPAVWLWRWELQGGKQLRNSAPHSHFLFCRLPSPRHTPSSSPPQPHFLSPSLGQHWQPLTSYCRMLIEKTTVTIRCVSNTRSSLLDRKERWANNFNVICNNPQNEKNKLRAKK